MNIKLKKKPVYLKFLGNMFVVLIAPFLMLFVVYLSLTSKIKEQTYVRNVELLENSGEKIELLFDGLDRISLYYKNNAAIINYCGINATNMKKSTSFMIQAQKELSTMKVGNNDVLDIQIYSSISDTMIDYFTMALFTDRYYGSSFYLTGLSHQQFKQEYLKQTSPITYSNVEMVAKGRLNKVLVYNKNLVASDYSRSDNRIIFYVSIDRMLQFFNAVEYQEDGFVCMLDENGKVLLNDSQLSYDIKQLDYSLFQSDKGYSYQNMDGKKMFITYYRNNDRGWLYLEAIPASKVLAITNGFRTFMLCLLILAVFVGTILVILIARKLSKPIIEAGFILGHQEKKVPLEDFVYEITKLVEHNTDLMDKMQQQTSVMRTEAFFKLLKGECISEETIREDLDRIGIRQNAAHYVILLLTCNDINLDAKLEEISAQKVFLDNVIRKQDFIEIHDIYQIDFERMIILMVSDDPSSKNTRERAERLINNVNEIITQNTVYSISVGGDMVDNALKLPKAFIHSQRALNVSRNVFGVHKIQWYARAKQYMDMEGHELMIQEEDYVSLQNQVLIEKIKDYINMKYNDPQLSLTAVGEEFFITEIYLSKLFRRATGENFSKYIEGLRMRYAKELIDQNKRIIEVAELVGYNSPQVFRRAWKRYYGGTPSDN